MDSHFAQVCMWTCVLTCVCIGIWTHVVLRVERPGMPPVRISVKYENTAHLSPRDASPMNSSMASADRLKKMLAELHAALNKGCEATVASVEADEYLEPLWYQRAAAAFRRSMECSIKCPMECSMT